MPLKFIISVVLIAAVTSCSARVEFDRPSVTVAADALNINTATADQLERLPSIGPKTAESIVQFRTENGPFRRVEHLMLVRGVSERRFAELRPHLNTE